MTAATLWELQRTREGMGRRPHVGDVGTGRSLLMEGHSASFDPAGNESLFQIHN